MVSLSAAMRASLVGVIINALLATIKIFVGVVGNCYALIADGIESTTDIVSSIAVLSGLYIAKLPPDDNHPYGHTKAESIAAMVVSFLLFGAALLIAVESIKEIMTPHHAPAWYALPVLVVVIIVKESLFRFVIKVNDTLDSTALKGDAWHHRADAITSAAAFVGITIALIGGKGYEAADDYAALAACCVIVVNSVSIFRAALHELMDGSVPTDTQRHIRRLAQDVAGVVAIEKCRIRKSGVVLLMDIHVQVDGGISVTEGHSIGHNVKNILIASTLNIADVVVHIEPVSIEPASETP